MLLISTPPATMIRRSSRCSITGTTPTVTPAARASGAFDGAPAARGGLADTQPVSHAGAGMVSCRGCRLRRAGSRLLVSAEPGVRHAWRLLGRAFLWLPVVGAVQWVATALLPARVVLVALAVVFAGLLAARAALAARISYRGLRCRECQTTYAYGTPFFTDLAAHPRGLTVADVPRPLGSSLSWRGASVDSESPKPKGRLPE